MEFQSTGKRIAGHMVTVVGAQDVAGVKYLDIHDSASPTFLDIYKINGTQVVDYRYQAPVSNTTIIRFAFAESYAECPNIAGNWSGQATAYAPHYEDSLPITFSLSQDGCNVSGTITSPESCPGQCGHSSGAITGNISGNIFSFTMPQNPMYECDSCEFICYGTDQGSLTISGNSMSGNATVEDCEDNTFVNVMINLTRSGSASSLKMVGAKKAHKESSILFLKGEER